MSVHVTEYNNIIHNTAQNGSDNLPYSYSPDNHHILSTGGEEEKGVNCRVSHTVNTDFSTQ